MPINRRRFVRTALSAAAAGAVAPLTVAPRLAAAAPMAREKLETFSLNPTYVAHLRKGVAAMKALPAKDHRSWFWQAAVHAVQSSWVAALPAGTAPSAADQTKFWNQCPHNPSHGSAEFLIWHRAYLYYFERTLRVMASDPTLSLPYWNYENAAQRKLPEIYRTPTTGNPLYIPERTPSLNAGTGSLSAASVDDSAAMASTIFFGTTSANFGGYIAIGTEPSNKGLIEQRPHDTVHGAIGSPGWMGSVPTAAFDPIFWPHHTEIDHLFTLWDCRGKREWGPPSSYDAWWDKPVGWFMDANGTAVNPPRRMFAKNANLDVHYDDQTPDCVPLDPPVSSRTLFSLGDVFARQAVRLGTAPGTSLSADQPVSATVPINAKALRSKASPNLFAATSPEHLVLGVGVAYSQTPSVAYYVDVSAGAGSPSYRAGVLTFFDHGGMAMDKSVAAEHLFDISAFARRNGLSAENLQVTFVPFDLVVDAQGNPGAKRVAEVRVGPIDVRDVSAPR
jgi:Common central domain of tyrosinase